MDCMPGLIHSGDDFVVTAGGILITETTITQFKGFDNYNELTKAKEASRCVIAGRVDTDPKGCPEWGWAPFFAGGTVQAKITTAALAKDLKFWAHMGNPDGDDFLAAPFFAAHPEYQWESAYLHDMKAYPWTLFGAK